MDTSDFAALERREWADEQVARSYATAFAKASDMVVPHLVCAVAVGRGDAALDLCCGHGNVSAGLAQAGGRVTGLDFSPVMIGFAREAVPDVTFVEGDAMNLPFEDGSFDAVTIGFGMPHLPDPAAALHEARRVLAPGGRLAFSVWCGADETSAMGYVFDAIAEHGDKTIALPPGPGASDYADPETAYPALSEAGFGDFSREVVRSCWTVDDPGAPFDFFREGTARGGALLRPQPPGTAAAIRAAVAERVLGAHGSGPEWIVPIPAVVISARAI
jgi:SAM-dependent methyltransferase